MFRGGAGGSPGWHRVWRNKRTTDSLSEALLILYSSWPPFTHICTHSCKTHTGTHMCPHTHLHMGTHTMLLAQYGRHEPKCTQPLLRARGSVEHVVFTIPLNPRYNPLIWEYHSLRHSRTIKTGIFAMDIHHTQSTLRPGICSPSSPKASIAFLDSCSKWPQSWFTPVPGSWDPAMVTPVTADRRLQCLHRHYCQVNL